MLHTMTRAARRAAAAGLTLAAATLLAACGGGSTESDDTATVRLVNLSPGYASLDLYADDSLRNADVAFLAAGAAVETPSGTDVETAVHAADGSTALNSTSRTLTAGRHYTVLAYGWQGGLKTAMVEESSTAADSGYANVTVMNLAVDAGALDVYLTASDDALESATPLASAVAGGSSATLASRTAGTYRLRVTGSGDPSDLRLDIPALTLASQQVLSLVLTSGSSGVLVHGVLLVHEGAATALANTQARVRVVSAVGGGGRVTASAQGQALVSNALAPNIGGWASVSGSSAASVQVAVNGTAVSLGSQSLPAGSDTTVLVWGDAAAPQVQFITEDNRLPTVSTKAKLRLVHAMAGVSEPLTLTADYSPLASDVAQGTASAWATLTGGVATLLEVSTPASSTPLYSQAETTLQSKGVYTLFLFGDASSVRPVLRKER